MKWLLKGFGATEEDLERMESGIVHGEVPRDQQTVMSHRRIAFHRMLLDTVNQELSAAHAHACTKIPTNSIASSVGEGVKLSYRRYLH